MTRNTDVGIPIIGKHVIKSPSKPNIHRLTRLSMFCIPERIVLLETIFKWPARVVLMDNTLTASAITSMYAKRFPEQFLDRRDKLTVLREI